ncbi:HNH endonuclease [Gordonia phage Lysidious]|nr:HNH endonuclease [Gordonia phage Lysidious]
MSEQWLPVPGWDGFYEVSDQGRIRSVDRVIRRGNGSPQHIGPRILAANPRPSGHLCVRLYRNGRGVGMDVHTAVLTAFVGPRPDGHEACHSNGDATDNRLTNLRWDTRSENNFDRVRHGTHNNSTKTRCARGHLYDEANTYRTPSRPTARYCRKCTAINGRNYLDRKSNRRSIPA